MARPTPPSVGRSSLPGRPSRLQAGRRERQRRGDEDRAPGGHRHRFPWTSVFTPVRKVTSTFPGAFSRGDEAPAEGGVVEHVARREEDRGGVAAWLAGLAGQHLVEGDGGGALGRCARPGSSPRSRRRGSGARSGRCCTRPSPGRRRPWRSPCARGAAGTSCRTHRPHRRPLPCGGGV